MNLTSEENLALARFFDTFMKEAMDRMTVEDMQQIHAILLKLLDYSLHEQERCTQVLEGKYDPLR